MAVGRVLSVMITGTGRKSWVQISGCIIWMFRIPNYIAVWKNEIETSPKAHLPFPKRKWIGTSLFSNRRPQTSLYKEFTSLRPESNLGHGHRTLRFGHFQI